MPTKIWTIITLLVVMVFFVAALTSQTQPATEFRTNLQVPLSGDVVPEVRFDKHEHVVTALAALQSGFVASADQSGLVRVWNPLDGTTIGEYTGHAAAGQPVLAMTPVGSTAMASASATDVHVWHPERPGATRIFGIGSTVHALLELANGNIAVGTAKGVQILDADSGDTVVVYNAQHEVRFLVELGDGRIVSSSVSTDTTVRGIHVLTDVAPAGGTINIWHPDDPTQILDVFSGHESDAAVFAFDGDLILSGSVQGPRDFKIWDPNSPAETLVQFPQNWSMPWAQDVSLLETGTAVTTIGDDQVFLWDVRNGRHSRVVSTVGPTREVTVLANGTIVWSENTTVLAWKPPLDW